MQAARNWIAEHGERQLFSLLGLIFVGFSVARLWAGDIPGMSAAFGLGFLSFLYANVARFRKFKGLGFEAELWEDKKKEAENLIERLKGVVSVYTHELVMRRASAGRWSSEDWTATWKLYDDLINRHGELGQNIDFSKLKREVDDYFLFDMTLSVWEYCRHLLWTARQKAGSAIKEKHGGSVIRDVEAYGADLDKIREINIDLDGLFSLSMQVNFARHISSVVEKAENQFKSGYSIDPGINRAAFDRLEAIAPLYESRPVAVTEELIEWANTHDFLPPKQ